MDIVSLPGEPPFRVVSVGAAPEIVNRLLRIWADVGFESEWEQVETEAAFLQSLSSQPNLIFAAFSESEFDGFRALEILKTQGLKIPFMMVPDHLADKLALVPRTVLNERQKIDERVVEQASLLDAAYEAIFVRDMEDRITYWNMGAVRTYGWTRSEAIQAKFHELFKTDPTLQQIHETHLEKGSWEAEVIRYTKDNREITVHARWTLVRDSNGNPKSVLAIEFDITKRKKREKHALQAQRLESIGTLAGGIAHDLNNVFAPILMSIDLLKIDTMDPRLTEVIETLHTNAKRGAEMVQQILNFSRGVDGLHISVNVYKIVQEIEKFIHDTFPRNITFGVKKEEDLWTIMADPTQIHQVLINLCVNARDAMPRGGTITVSLENHVLDDVYSHMNPELLPGPYVIIKVADNGAGIQPEDQARVFDPFFTTKEADKGTGLGLSTVMGIVKGHGGCINLYSEPGRGTLFKIYLPANANAKEAEKTAILQTKLPRGQGQLILVVDDEESVRNIVKRTLERFGYQVALACNGAEAISVYVQLKHSVAAVLTDMAMPVMDGPSTIIALRSIDPDIKIIGSSGLASNGLLTMAMGAGVDHFIPKPYSVEIMLKTLAELLHDDPTPYSKSEPNSNQQF